MPHRPVIKLGSTTPIRPVFDASSHQKDSPSLNDCLEKGPNLIEQIPDILEEFRDKRIGVVSDIEKAFLQLEVVPQDRDFLRFFGVDGVEYRHKRVVFGVTSSPFLLSAVIKFHLERMKNKYEETVRKLERAFYVDNCVTSVESIEELVQFMNEAVEIMKEGCFNLRGWDSNIGISPSSVNSREISVLGLIWNLGKDTLSCRVSNFNCEKITKRIILSCAQRVYDPIGFTCPVTLVPKILLQKLWSLKIDWDEPVPEEYEVKFAKWKNEILLLDNIEIPRFTKRRQNSTLHVFTDASQEAYAACVFLRTEEEKSVQLVLLRAKSRVAPVDRMTIPRLELMACLIGVRLVCSIKQALNNPSIQVNYWSDSTNALFWITREGNWTTFVQNRVKEIRTLTSAKQWKYVPGDQNPADLPSRGCSPIKLLQGKWWEGPAWLKEPEDCWPDQNVLGVKRCVEEQQDLQLSNLKVTEGELSVLDRISNYMKIIKVVAWIRRFIHNSKINNTKIVGPLYPAEISEAEKMIIRTIQSTYITGHRRASLARVIEDDEGLLRIETKITERMDSADFLYPIILPGSHPIVMKLIEEEHRKSCHVGPQILFGILRERFWIVGLKKVLKKVIGSCVRCKRYLQKPLLVEPAPLPKDRVADSVAFEVTGIDLAGPLYVKEGKVWIVLFTCGVYRAIHLELVTSLTTICFLQALRRFIARRGRPSIIYTDNGTNFCGAENKFRDLDWTRITQESDTVRIKWKFNPPTAAWWGGWWERLVRVVKELLRRTLGRARLGYEELSTVLCECESVINSRPLTYCSGDSDEMIPITPLLFLRDLRRGGVEDIDEIEATHLQKRVRYRQKLVADLRQRFRREYLGMLIGKTHPQRGMYTCKVGEVVIIGDDQTKRAKWPLGVVSSLHPGKDGRIRCVSLKTANGIIVRPVQRIYPLELEGTTERLEEVPDVQAKKPQMTPEEDTERHDSSASHDTGVLKTTRGGRPIRHPTRLDLCNNALYLFDPRSNKGGRMLEDESIID